MAWLSTPLVLLVSGGVCYLAIVNYVTKELHRDMRDVSNDELAGFEQTFAGAMVVGVAVAFAVHSKEVRLKVSLLGFGAAVMVATTDTKWNKKALPNPDAIQGQPGNAKKRIVFIRHGESLWNEAFNGSKRPDKFLYQTLRALFGEFMLLPELDSVLLDSPLNELGFNQAKTLARALKTYPRGRQEDQTPQLDRDVAAIRGDDGAPTSVVCASNLRRAAQTAAVALWDRLRPDDDDEALAAGTPPGTYPETVKVLSCLQEVSRNVDTLSLTGRQQPVPLQGVTEALGLEEPVDPARLFDAAHNFGNKPVFGTGLQRLDAFCAWAFEQPEEVVVCAGHSLWFKHFFNTYLPPDDPSADATHDAKDCKMKNGGCVAFTLERGLVGDGAAATFVYRADPHVLIVDGGFDNKKKKQKADAKAAAQANASDKKKQ